jgi:hypothetical protein
MISSPPVLGIGVGCTNQFAFLREDLLAILDFSNTVQGEGPRVSFF